MNITEELQWINFCEAKRAGDSRNELIAFFGSRTYEQLEARYQREHPTPLIQRAEERFDFASVLK